MRLPSAAGVWPDHAGHAPMLGLAGLTLVVGLVSGSYPALFMSSLQPMQVLKGRMKGRSRRLRSLLIVGQYAVSMVLVVGSMIIYQQMRYMYYSHRTKLVR